MCVCVCVCVYVCIINIQVPHEVHNQRAVAKRTSQMMKYGQNINIQIGKWYFKRNIFDK